MKSTWQTKQLGELLQKTENINPTITPNIEFIYIDVSSISNKTFEIINFTKIKGINAPSRARKKIKSGDIIFATVRPTLMRIAVVPDKFDGQVCSTGYFVFRPNKYIVPRFLFYFLTSDIFIYRMSKLQKGASYPAVTDGDVKNTFINFPESLPEQHRIVKILDEVFENIAKAKANAEKNLQNSKDLFESYLQNFFSNPNSNFENKKIKEIADIKGGKRVPRGYKLKLDKTEYPYIRVADFNDCGSVDLLDIKYIDKDIYEQIKHYTISTKDLYISIAGTIGKTGIISEELEGANLTENACKLVFKDNIYNKYIYYFTKSSEFVKQAGLNTRKVAMPKLALSRLGGILIPIPESLSEQKAIVAKLDALSNETKKLESIYKQKIADLEELKKSVLKKAFNGEL